MIGDYILTTSSKKTWQILSVHRFAGLLTILTCCHIVCTSDDSRVDSDSSVSKLMFIPVVSITFTWSQLIENFGPVCEIQINRYNYHHTMTCVLVHLNTYLDNLITKVWRVRLILEIINIPSHLIVNHSRTFVLSPFFWSITPSMTQALPL